MSKHYSPKRFFREVPVDYLVRYFKQKQLLAEFDFNQWKESGVEALNAALEALPEELRNGVEQDFNEIDALACEGGIKAILDDVDWYGETSALLPGIESRKSFHEKAFWVFLEHPKYWPVANAFFHADTIHTKFWRKRINLPKSPAHVAPENIGQLEKNLVKFFHDKEGRGKNCKVDCYKRGTLDYFFAYPEDYPQNRMVWKQRELRRQPETPAFEIIFIFDPDEGSLEVYLDGTRKIVPELQTIFAGAILDFELTDDDKDNRVYNLNPLKQTNVNFQYSPESGIVSVAVKKLRLKLVSTNRRITLEANPTHNSQVVYEMLATLKKNYPTDSMVVTQVGIVVTFAPSPNRSKPKTRSFDIGWPNSCSLKHDGNDKIIRQMLVDSGLEPRQPGF
jgi:hypothetical protein